VGATWDSTAGKWRLDIKRPKENAGDTGEIETEVFEDTTDLLFTGIGALSRWDWPDIEGLHTFKGSLIHSARWEVATGSANVGTPISPKVRLGWEEDVKDWGNKKVAVIGVVSS
jgi:hypothetical protein